PVRCDFSSKSFEQVAKALHEFFRESTPFHHLSLAKIQEDADVQGPLFEHLFVFQNFPLEHRAAETTVDNRDFSIIGFKGHESTSYPLNIVVHEQDDLVFAIKYNAARIDHHDVERIHTHLHAALAQAVPKP